METNTTRPQPTELSAQAKLKLLRNAAWVTNEAAAFAYFMAADFHDDSKTMIRLTEAIRELRRHASKVWNHLHDVCAATSEKEVDSI